MKILPRLIMASLGIVNVAARAGTTAPLAGWRVETRGSASTAAADALRGLKVPLHAELGGPTLREWRDSPVSKDIGLLIYESGASGTHDVHVLTWAVIINKKTLKVAGQDVWRIESLPGSTPLPQPTWKWGPDSVEVFNNVTHETAKYTW